MPTGKFGRLPLALVEAYRGTDFLPLYTTTVTVTGGESGHGRATGIARSDDGNLLLVFRLPAALGGPGGGTNPEQVFAAGYAACFHGALQVLAAKARIPIGDATVQATVTYGRDPVDAGFTLRADLQVRLPGVAPAVVEELVRGTERICPYAKMARQGVVGRVRLVGRG